MIATTLALLALGAPGLGDGPKPPAFDKFLLIPLRVHVLVDPELELANCKIRDDAVRKSVANANAIWSVAGIAFGLESIVREPASRRDRFRTIVELNDGQVDPSAFGLLLSPQGRVFDGLHVFIFHELGMNGAYLGEDTVLTIEEPQLRQVDGGSDDGLARVMARGLGQALGLPVQPLPTALLAAGTNGQVLTPAEVDRARTVARTVAGCLPVAALRKAAEADQAKSKLYRSWLAAIPGATADLKKPAEAKP